MGADMISAKVKIINSLIGFCFSESLTHFDHFDVVTVRSLTV